MNQDRYIQLIKEFEQRLDRSLTGKEKLFIQWIVSREKNGR